MSGFDRGTIVRVPFPYADRPVQQHRPALVVSGREIGEGGNGFLWVVMITSAANRPWPDDVAVGEAAEQTGLPAPSIVRAAKIATIEARHAEAIGRLAPDTLRQVDAAIGRLLGRSSQS